MSCSPGWRATAASTCPRRWPQLRRRPRLPRLLAGCPTPNWRRTSSALFAGAASSREAELAMLCRRRLPRLRCAIRTWRRCAAGPTALHLLELFHGPTLAFKDFALQLLGRLFDLVLARRGERITIVGATSGDTGSAAIEACRDRDAIDIFILHPKGRVSEVQRRQMTTVVADNVHNIAIEGTFDDCQDLVKALFTDAAVPRPASGWRRSTRSTGRGSRPRSSTTSTPRCSSARPTGRWRSPCRPAISATSSPPTARARMGLPIDRLIVASNRNDILTRFFATGRWRSGAVFATLQPEHGHPGLEQFRALSVRAVRPRRGADVAALMRRFRDDAGLRRRAASAAGARADVPGRRAATTRRRAQTIRAVYERDRHAGRSAHRHRHRRRPRAPN